MFSGSIPALVTPFRDGGIDGAAFQAFVDWQITEGSAALVPCGTTGEAATLSHDEHHHVIRLCVAAAGGRVPVIAGCGSNDTATALAHLARAAKSGADAALVVVPYYNKPSQAGLVAHFRALSDASELPIVAYNVPGRTVVDLLPETLAEIAALANVVGIKDASGRLERVGLHRASCGPDFCQLSGNDEVALGYMASGGHGCISVTANVAPKLCAAFQAACAAGDFAAARALDDRLLPLHLAMFADASPGPAKYALARAGRMADELRLPILSANAAARAAVDAALVHAGIDTTDKLLRLVPGHTPTGDQWTDNELYAAVDLYRAIFRRPNDVKSLIATFMQGPLSGRNFASVTYRLRNISAVAVGAGLPVLKTHSPAENVGARVTDLVRRRLLAVWDQI